MRKFSNFRKNSEVIKIVETTLSTATGFSHTPQPRLDNDCIEEIVKTLKRSVKFR